MSVSLAAPLGLLALLALPAIVALHLFRRRFATRRVAGLFLFPRGDLAAASGRKRTRLLRTPSLLLELAAAVCLSLWLAGLSCGAGSAARHLVIVLDDSASMGARGPEGSCTDRARAQAGRALAALPGAAQVTLILTGARPEIVAGPRAPAAVLSAALAHWRPLQPRHDPLAALELGLEIAGPEDELLFLTDDAALRAPPRYRVFAVGEPLPNAAIARARRIRSGAGETLLADLIAFGPAPIETALRVGTEAEELARRSVTLVPGRTAHVSVPLPDTAGPVTVSLAPDALAADDSVLLLPEPQKTVLAAVLLSAEVAGLLALDRVLAALPFVRRTSDPAAAALVFCAAPGRLEGGAVEVVVHAAGRKDERDDWVGPFLMDRRDPLLAGVTLEGVVWSAGPGALPGFAVVLAGDQPLVAEELLGDGVRLTLNLDPERSNLPSSPDWPILLANLAERARAGLPGAQTVNVRVGEEILWRSAAGRDAAPVSLVDPDGRSEPGRGIGLLSWPARRPGLHRLVEGGRELGRFAVAFADARESDLTGCGAGATAPAAAGPGQGAARVQAGTDARGAAEGRALALLLLALLAADWFVLRGRPAA